MAVGHLPRATFCCNSKPAAVRMKPVRPGHKLICHLPRAPPRSRQEPNQLRQSTAARAVHHARIAHAQQTFDSSWGAGTYGSRSIDCRDGCWKKAGTLRASWVRQRHPLSSCAVIGWTHVERLVQQTPFDIHSMWPTGGCRFDR